MTKAGDGREAPSLSNVDSVQAAILGALDGGGTTHAEAVESLMTLKFQRLENVPVLAASGMFLPRTL